MRLGVLGWVIGWALCCPPGQYKPKGSDDVCKTCPRGCATCELRQEDVICHTCLPGFFLQEFLQCEKCVDHCKKCIGITVDKCFEIEKGFFFDQGKKQILECGVEHCAACYEQGKCAACELGFVLDVDLFENNKKKCFSCNEHCQKCSHKPDQFKNAEFVSCDVCVEGFALSENICRKCPENCTKCAGAGLTCSTCNVGFMLQSGQNKCIHAAANCYMAGEDGSCLICEEGFFLKKGECMSCGEKTKNCVQCGTDETDSKCHGCRPAFYVTTEGKCEKCQADCDRCNSQGCTGCKEEHYYDAEKKECRKCGVPFCFVCESEKRCDLCLLGFYVDQETKGCTKCPESCLFCQSKDNCLQCSVSFIPLTFYSPEVDAFKTQCFQECPPTFEGRAVIFDAQKKRCA